ncbi:MAG: tRNA lysidine(34) synthetase TilS [Ignavibacteriae bacterium]|nr:tRNA lysidine(34) synthetase TilS [Ignavibacteriota bacterium]
MKKKKIADEHPLKDFELNKSQLLKKVENYLINELFVENGDKLVIAVSGGVDSIVLLNLIYQLSFIYNFKIIPAHFNHKLRGKRADDDEKFVKSICNDYKLKCISGKGDVRQYAGKNSLSIEHAARVLRYNFLERVAHENNCSLVATAHTLDDMTETFFLNLLRGSGITGLCGIPKKRLLTKKVSLIRPLINITKDELKSYANKKGLKWSEDESNKLMNFTRNKIRKKLIPLIREDFEPGINEKIQRTTSLLSGAERYIKDYVAELTEKIITNRTSDGFAIKLGLFNSLDDFIQGELIEHLITTKYHQSPLTMANIERLKDLSESKIGTIVDISKDLFALKDRNKLIISKKRKNAQRRIELKKEDETEFTGMKIILKEVKKKDVIFNQSVNIEYLDYDLIPQRLILRSWEKGDVFNPLGMKGKMKVSDFLINNKVSILDKKEILLLSTGKDIVWVCGMRIDDKYKVTNQTLRYLKVEIIPKVQ